SWGTTFAKVLCDAGNDVMLWARRAELADAIANGRGNNDYLPGLVLPASLRATHDPSVALDGAELVAIAIPDQHLRENLAGWAPLLPRDATVLSLMKGVELGTTLRMSEVIAEAAGVEPARVGALSGPNLAREIAAGQPTATVVA